MKALGIPPVECSVCKKGVACPINAQHLLDTILEAVEFLKMDDGPLSEEGQHTLAKMLKRSVGETE